MCSRHLHTMLSIVLTPRQDPALPLDPQPLQPQHEPGHCRRPEWDEHYGRLAWNSPLTFAKRQRVGDGSRAQTRSSDSCTVSHGHSGVHDYGRTRERERLHVHARVANPGVTCCSLKRHSWCDECDTDCLQQSSPRRWVSLLACPT